MPEKDIGAKCRDRAVQVERLEKPLDAAGKGAKVSLRDRALQAWNRKQDLSGTEPCRWQAHLAGGKASVDAAVPTVKARKASGRCSA